MPRPTTAGKVRVLLVDDEPDTLEVVRRYLETQGYDVRAETSAEGAVVAVRDFGPAVVLSDISMPGIDGIELAQQLRLKSPGLPIIAITAQYDDDLMRARMKKAGFVRTLVKPVEPAAVLEAIAFVLGR